MKYFSFTSQREMVLHNVGEYVANIEPLRRVMIKCICYENIFIICNHQNVFIFATRYTFAIRVMIPDVHCDMNYTEK